MIYNKQGKVVKLKKSTIDLRGQGRLDWFARSIEEQNAKEKARTIVIEQETTLEGAPMPTQPTFTYNPQLEKVSWFELLSSIDYSRIWKIILP